MSDITLCERLPGRVRGTSLEVTGPVTRRMNYDRLRQHSILTLRVTYR